VEVYLGPVVELQAAERTVQITGDQIKTSMLSFADLIVSCTQALRLTQDAFERQNAEEITFILKYSTSVFSDENNVNVNTLKPVFDTLTARSFVYQRLNDIIVASASASDAMKKATEYRKTVSFWRRNASKWGGEKFKSLVPLNLDLAQVKKYSILQLQSQMTSKKYGASNMDKLRANLHSLGNGGVSLALNSTLSLIMPILVACYFFI
jgi:hypothetical protein